MEYKEGKAYPIAWGVMMEAPATIYQERVDMLESIGLGEYLDAECFGLLAVKGCYFCIDNND